MHSHTRLTFQLPEHVETFAAQVGIKTTLHNSDQRLVLATGYMSAALGPTQTTFGGRGDLVTRTWQRHDMVEDHGDVAAQDFLNLDRALWR